MVKSVRTQKVLKEKIWDIKKLRSRTDPETTEYAIRTGIIMGLQWALGLKRDEKTGDILSGIACGEVVKGKENANL